MIKAFKEQRRLAASFQSRWSPAFRLFAAALAFTLSLTVTYADRLRTLEGDLIEAQVNEITPDHMVLLDDGTSWSLDKLRSIVPSHNAQEIAEGQHTIWLTNGSRFSTSHVTMSEEVYQINHPALGALEIPIDLVWAIRLANPLPDSRFMNAVRDRRELIDDIIYVNAEGAGELQEVEGLTEDVTPEQLVFDQGGELKNLPVEKVHGVVLASPLFEVPNEDSWITCHLTLTDGSLISGNVTRLKDDAVTIALGDDLEWQVPWLLVQRFSVESSLLHYLSDRDPVEETMESIYAFPRPWKRDQNVRGHSLRLQRDRFEKGLGVAAGTTLTYQNDKAFTLFTATIGIDAQREPFGDCEFVITSGKDELFRQRLRSTDEPHFVRLEIDEIETLTLSVLPGGGALDLADDANWAEACFLDLELDASE